jgi:ADP-ribose pyrophosphatase YjhB (NUDIX family)
VFEETGLRVRPTRVAAVVGGPSCRVRYRNGDEVEYVVTVFDCAIVGGTLLESSDETKGAAYFHVDALPKLAFEYPSETFLATAQAAHFAAADAG